MARMRKDKSIRNYIGTLRALFNFAGDKRRRWTRHNPVDDIDLPNLPTYAEIRYLTSDEIWSLVDAVNPGPYLALDRAMYLTAAMTGLRIGELQALDWRNVDYQHTRIRVRRTWDRKAKTSTMPKSRRSERAVPMPDVVATALEQMFKAHHRDAVEAHPDALVFADPVTGDPLGHERMYLRLRDALKTAGLDETYGFHSLRHSYGTALAGQGVPMRTLQEWMGHKDICTTQRYADYCPNPGERDIVEAAFARGYHLRYHFAPTRTELRATESSKHGAIQRGDPPRQGSNPTPGTPASLVVISRAHRRGVVAQETSASSSSINPGGATTIPAGAAASATSGRTTSPEHSHSSDPAAMSHAWTPRS